jgi:hypothetical protein
MREIGEFGKHEDASQFQAQHTLQLLLHQPELAPSDYRLKDRFTQMADAVEIVS